MGFYFALQFSLAMKLVKLRSFFFFNFYRLHFVVANFICKSQIADIKFRNKFDVMNRACGNYGERSLAGKSERRRPL